MDVNKLKKKSMYIDEIERFFNFIGFAHRLSELKKCIFGFG